MTFSFDAAIPFSTNTIFDKKLQAFLASRNARCDACKKLQAPKMQPEQGWQRLLGMGMTVNERENCFDFHAAQNFHIPESGYVTQLGTGGRTVEKVVKYDLPCVRTSNLDIVILELGTNDHP